MRVNNPHYAFKINIIKTQLTELPSGLPVEMKAN